MPFSYETYRVLIASPSDLPEERQAATDAINEWNAEHAAAEGVVLLPVKWETHVVPESGRRPQEVINRQLVQECDILVGMFWTKLGTATGAAESVPWKRSTSSSPPEGSPCSIFRAARLIPTRST